MTKICNNCGQILPEDEFYKTKNVCMRCYKRQMRGEKRIKEGRRITTVAELIAELRTIPGDAEIVLCDDMSLYHPVTVEFVRKAFKGYKDYDIDLYNNVVVIV